MRVEAWRKGDKAHLVNTREGLDDRSHVCDSRGDEQEDERGGAGGGEEPDEGQSLAQM